MTDRPLKVLLVEDNPGDARLVREYLKDARFRSFELDHVSTLKAGFEMLDRAPFDLMLLDLSLPDSSGIETCVSVMERFPDVPIIVLTGFEDESVAIRALNEGAQDYLVKGQVDGALIERAIAYAIERSRAQAEERRQRNLYETLLRVQSDVGEGVFILEKKRFVFVNEAFCRITRQSEEALLSSPSWEDRCAESDRERVAEYIDAVLDNEYSGPPIEFRLLTDAGEQVTVDLVASAIESQDQHRLVAIVRDITERKRMIGQLLRAQRVESIGTLASGIAHDLNNSLTPILAGAQLLAVKLDRDADTRHMLEVMIDGVNRSADMVKQLLAFARGVEGDRIVLQARHLVTEIRKILSKTLPRSIHLAWNIDTELWPVLGDATQLHQVLMNLCLNARDAMGVAGGTLTIIAENLVLDENYARMCSGGRPGEFVRLTVIDTGTGIAPEIQEKLFEPFFTTKEPGAGTGLGLYTSMGIVQAHGGFINVYSEEGNGSRFQIYLPAARLQGGPQTVEQPVEIPDGHGEGVLVVDDEAAIREILCLTLRAHGYEAFPAANGAEALHVYEEREAKIDVVVTDMMMPGMDGKALIRELRGLSPELRIVASSGLPQAAKDGAVADEVDAVLTKPYTAETLLEILDALLSRSPRAGQARDEADHLR